MALTPKQMKHYLKSENRCFTKDFVAIDPESWPEDGDRKRFMVFRSRDYLVQVFREENCTRLSVNRTMIDGSGNWLDGMTWDDLNAIKSALGYGDKYAVEVYPRDCDTVNVANMRHLWILDQPLDIGWFSNSPEQIRAMREVPR